LEILKAIAPLIVELILHVLHGSKARSEERTRTRDEVVAAVRGGDAAAVNRLAVRMRLARKVRGLEAARAKRDQAREGRGADYR